MAKRNMTDNTQDLHGRREKILSYIFDHPEGCGRNDIAKNVNIPHGTVSKYLDILDEEKLIFRHDAEKGKKNLIFPAQIIADQESLKDAFRSLEKFKQLFPKMSQIELKNTLPHYLFSLSLLQMSAWTEYISGNTPKALEISNQIVKRELDNLLKLVYYNFAKSNEKASERHYAYLNQTMNTLLLFFLQKTNLTTVGGFSKISVKPLNNMGRLLQNFDAPVIHAEFIEKLRLSLQKGKVKLEKAPLKLESEDTELLEKFEIKQKELQNVQQELDLIHNPKLYEVLHEWISKMSDDEYVASMESIGKKRSINSRQELLGMIEQVLEDAKKLKE